MEIDTAPESRVHIPGFPFLAAAALSVGSLVIFCLSTRDPVSQPAASASESGLTAA